MKNSIIAYFSILSLIVILLLQAFAVYDNFKITRSFLTKEIGVVLDEASRAELNARRKNNKPGSITVIPPPPPNGIGTTVYDIDKMNIDKSDVLGLMNTAVIDVISKKRPLNIHKLDSITAKILQKHDIHSDYVVRMVNPQTGKVLKSSSKTVPNSHFLIYSKYYPLDFTREKSLQLILINPLASVFKRIGVLLVGSFLLSLFCIYGLWFLFRTLSKQKKLSDLKNDFFGHTAHELKRPVAHLQIALDALSNTAINENSAKRERYLSISKEATRDISEKINMIMTLSMAEEGVFRLNYSKFNLQPVLVELKEKFLAIAEKEVVIEIDNQANELVLTADKEHLTQSLANLIDNAIKYSKDSVRINVVIRRIKNELLVLIKDNGIGINGDKIEHIFEKYTRLNTEAGSPSGFGIGLSYVKTVIEKHSGHIEVKSEPDGGSEFVLSLPV